MPKSTATELNATNLKNVLWETLKQVKSGKMTPAAGDVVAAQAREILRTTKVQLTIFSQSGQGVSAEVVGFAQPKTK